MYIKNRRNSSKLKAFSSYQNLCLTESNENTWKLGQLAVYKRTLDLHPI